MNNFSLNIIIFRSHDGGRIIFDDFREAYWWLRENTPEDAKVYFFNVKVKGHYYYIVEVKGHNYFILEVKGHYYPIFKVKCK